MTLRRGTRRMVLVGLVSALLACDRKPASDLEPPARSAASAVTKAPHDAAFDPPAKFDPPAVKPAKVEVPEVRVRTTGDTTVRVTWVTPSGTAVNDDAPFRVRWNRSDGLVEAPSDVRSIGSAVRDGFAVKVRPMNGVPNATLGGEIDIVVCDSATHSVCVPVRRAVELGFVAVADAVEQATVSIPLPAAK